MSLKGLLIKTLIRKNTAKQKTDLLDRSVFDYFPAGVMTI
jgi:hypothetical protein